MMNVNALPQKVGDFIRFRDNKDIIFRVALIILLSITDGAWFIRNVLKKSKNNSKHK